MINLILNPRYGFSLKCVNWLIIQFIENLYRMNHFIRNNFLAIWVTMAVIFAFARKATVYQKEPKKPETPLFSSPSATEKVFTNYWSAGKTETSTYQIQEEIAGKITQAEATLTFAIKPFDTDKQVEIPSNQSSEAINVLKMSLQEKYDFSAISTVYAPLDIKLFPHAPKVTHSFQSLSNLLVYQLNQHNRAYQIEEKSYANNQVSKSLELKRVWLEDEIWNRIRLSPETLPQDEIEIIPSFKFCSETQQTPTIQQAKGEIKDYTGTALQEKDLKVYALNYPATQRSIEIVFQKNFPYKIFAWTEKVLLNKQLTTRQAVLKKAL